MFFKKKKPKTQIQQVSMPGGEGGYQISARSALFISYTDFPV